MKTLAVTYLGGPHDGREDWIAPCATVSFGEHTAGGSVIHHYHHSCVDMETGRTIYTYGGWNHVSAKPRLLVRLGLRVPHRVTV